MVSRFQSWIIGMLLLRCGKLDARLITPGFVIPSREPLRLVFCWRGAPSTPFDSGCHKISPSSIVGRSAVPCLDVKTLSPEKHSPYWPNYNVSIQLLCLAVNYIFLTLVLMCALFCLRTFLGCRYPVTSFCPLVSPCLGRAPEGGQKGLTLGRPRSHSSAKGGGHQTDEKKVSLLFSGSPMLTLDCFDTYLHSRDG